MKGFVWKRVNRWIDLSIALTLLMCAMLPVFIIYSAVATLSSRPVSPWEWIGWAPAGLFIALMDVYLVICALQSLFEGITGWRPAHKHLWPLLGSPNAHLARGETECKF